MKRSISNQWYTDIEEACELNASQKAWLRINRISLSTSWLGLVWAVQGANAPPTFLTQIDMPKAGIDECAFDWEKSAENVRAWINEMMVTGAIDKYKVFRHNGEHVLNQKGHND